MLVTRKMGIYLIDVILDIDTEVMIATYVMLCQANDRSVQAEGNKAKGNKASTM
jgi:hypothetical protein